MRIARMIRASLAIAGAALVGFHGWLFAVQVAAGRLEDPWLVFRWIAAAALIAALVAVRRDGEPIWGRKSVAIWALAAVLHGPAIASDFQADFNSIALPETVVSTVLQLVSSAAFAVSLWLLAGLLRQRRRSAPIRYATAPVFANAGRRTAILLRRSAPRPPPIRS
jgi:hypothetical protein